MNGPAGDDSRLSPRAKLTIVVSLIILAGYFLLQIGQIISPFLWALLAAYLLLPIVNYLNVDGGLPRVWAVVVLYGLIGILVLAAWRYLYPQVVTSGTVFIEDIPRLENSLIAAVGPHPLGIDVSSVISQFLSAAGSSTTSARSAGHLIVNALETVVKLFLFLVTTFYLLLDAPRLGRATRVALPAPYRAELLALGRQINLTWQQYIRGELVLFALMSTVTTIGLTSLGVPGSVFLGIVSGALELLPLVGPMTAGSLAVSVAYFNGTNPYGWSQLAYAGAVALMYFVLRQAEDYLVMPRVLGRAVRLHPLVVLFAVAAGGVTGGLLGLVLAVPIAASLKAVLAYIYAKLLDLPVEFEPVRTLGGGVIEIPIHDPLAEQEQEDQHSESGEPQHADAG